MPPSTLHGVLSRPSRLYMATWVRVCVRLTHCPVLRALEAQDETETRDGGGSHPRHVAAQGPKGAQGRAQPGPRASPQTREQAGSSGA